MTAVTAATMPAAPSRLRQEHSAAMLAIAGLLLLLLAARLWVVRDFASATPFWDQWDAQAAFLFDPWLRGTLAPADLLAAHNEHRILATRLLALALLAANGSWSPLLEMTVNAFLNVAALGLGLVLAWRAAGRGSLPWLLAAAFAAFVLPHGWENILSGFQSQFYFVVLFAVAALWWLVVAPPFSPRWWGGAALAVLAYFSLASGAFAFAAAAAVLALRGLVAGGRRDLAAALLALALFLAAAAATPTLAVHASLKAASLLEFLFGAAVALSWPFGSPLLALLRNLPSVLLVAWVVRQRLPAADRRWFLVALCAWALGQELALAYGRAPDVLASRYLDLHAMAFFANAAALAALLPARTGRWRRTLGLLAGAWLLAGAFAFLSPAPHLARTLVAKLQASEQQERNLRDYLQSGDRAALRALPFFALPYPRADRLADIVASPQVRSILPPPLTAAAPGRLDGAALAVRDGWGLAALLGLALLVVALAARLRRQPAAA